MIENSEKYQNVIRYTEKSYFILFLFSIILSACNGKNIDLNHSQTSTKQFEPVKNTMSDTTYIFNKKLPVWIIPISGWEENATDRMNAYLKTAEKMKINITFSTQLGTANSYKYAPEIAKEINKHNEETFEVYRKELGEDWEQRFLKEVMNIMNKS